MVKLIARVLKHNSICHYFDNEFIFVNKENISSIFPNADRGYTLVMKSGEKFWLNMTTKEIRQESLTDISPSGFLQKRRLPTLPRVCSTIGAGGLNFSVRDGKRWNPATVTTLISLRHISQAKERIKSIQLKAHTLRIKLTGN